MNFKNFSKEVIASIVILNMVFPYSVIAANLKLNTRIHFRIDGVDSSDKPILKSLTVLPKGTIVEIPDEFVIKTNNQIDVNKSLNNWITKNSLKQTRFDKDGRAAYEHFFQVKIVKIPGDSSLNGHQGFVALNAIKEKDGIQLETIANTDLIDTSEFVIYDSPVQDSKPSSYANTTSDQTEAKTCIGNCDDDNSLVKKIRSTLKNELVKVKNQTNSFQRSKRPGDSFSAIAKNFERTCFGLKFDDFVNYVREIAPQNHVPAEVMLGILTQESAGICHAIGDKKATSKSVGLFQLNTGTVKTIKPCSANQLKLLSGKSINQMANNSSLSCLQNPAVSLQNGIKVLLDKYSLVNNYTQPTSSSWESMSLFEKDKFRKALSAYNGGQLYVTNTQEDISYAKNKFDIDLKTDWETTRLFMFRNKLRANGYVGSNKTRSKVNEIGNVAYTEAILGRGTGETSQKGFTDQWQVALDRRSSISVASRDN